MWLLLLPSLLLHQPSATSIPARRAVRVSYAARAAAVLRQEFAVALADRGGAIWRPPSDPSPPPPSVSAPRGDGASAPAAPAFAPEVGSGVSPRRRTTATQRRALRQTRHGRLSAAAWTLLSEPLAPGTLEIWRKVLLLFPSASPDLATAASVEAAFAAELASLAAAAGRLAVPRTVSRDTVTLAIRAALRGSSPGPSGHRVEHLWALAEGGREALVGVLLLLTGEAAMKRMPPVARAALAGADLMLVRKPGGLAADGLPKLRPIGMPEALRKLAASALARTVRDTAAALLTPHQQGVGVRSACERVLHELRAHLAACPTEAVVQLDFSNAFNRLSREAARVVAERTLPILTPYFDWFTGGVAPQCTGGPRTPTCFRWGAISTAPVRGAGRCPPPPPPRRVRRPRGCRSGPSGVPNRATRSARSSTRWPSRCRCCSWRSGSSACSSEHPTMTWWRWDRRPSWRASWRPRGWRARRLTPRWRLPSAWGGPPPPRPRPRSGPPSGG